MYYAVLINYCGLDPKRKLWSRLDSIKTFNRVLFLLKKEINSHEYFIYVRKVLDVKQLKPIVSNFRLITHTSYTFNHYPKIDDYRNKYLDKKFDSVDLFTDRSFLPYVMPEVLNEKY